MLSIFLRCLFLLVVQLIWFFLLEISFCLEKESVFMVGLYTMR